MLNEWADLHGRRDWAEIHDGRDYLDAELFWPDDDAEALGNLEDLEDRKALRHGPLES